MNRGVAPATGINVTGAPESTSKSVSDLLLPELVIRVAQCKRSVIEGTQFSQDARRASGLFVKAGRHRPQG